ncbi:MAG: hypothetical protein ACI85O_000840 [Saprospiraceae bacterium]|jgi:hypothetical protein
MTNKITSLFVAIATIFTLFFISSAPAVFAPESNVGIAETQCSSCHFGGSSGGSFEITGIPTSYTPDQTYSAQICLSDPATDIEAGGFSMYQTVSGAGAFTTADATTRIMPGNYLSHNGKKLFTGDEACWDFVWNAPSAGSGSRTLAAAGNAVNNDGANGGLDHGDYLTTAISSEGVLPVDLLDFCLSESDKNTVLLNWETATEINNDYFSVERSYNVREFEEIGKIEGAGNTSDNENYSFIDEKPELNRPIYYRLKQVDFDGAYEYSLIKKIMIEQPAITIEKVYPNPVFRSETVKVKFDLSTNVQNVEMIVYDILGHEKMKNIIAVSNGENVINFSPSDLVAGQYYISLIADNQSIMSDMFIVTK